MNDPISTFRDLERFRIAHGLPSYQPGQTPMRALEFKGEQTISAWKFTKWVVAHGKSTNALRVAKWRRANGITKREEYKPRNVQT